MAATIASNNNDNNAQPYHIDNSKPNHWEEALSHLTTYGNNRIPAFYFPHGSPLLIFPQNIPQPPLAQLAAKWGGPTSDNAKFLRYFGKFLIDTYTPKAIVVFSAHWETKVVEVMGYEDNSLYYDYSGFPDEMYDLKFESKGSPALANRITDLLKQNNIPAKAIATGRGFDHGVFVPFILMFKTPFEIPIIEVSMPSLDPNRLIEVGKALTPLRDEGVLILAGGVSIHTFKEMHALNSDTCPQGFKDFEREVVNSIELSNNKEERNKALIAVTKHPFFRRAHPREEHFVPIYIAAGAGYDDKAQVVSGIHGALCVAFGL